MILLFTLPAIITVLLVVPIVCMLTIYIFFMCTTVNTTKISTFLIIHYPCWYWLLPIIFIVLFIIDDILTITNAGVAKHAVLSMDGMRIPEFLTNFLYFYFCILWSWSIMIMIMHRLSSVSKIVSCAVFY